jgi:hypothetical protein
MIIHFHQDLEKRERVYTQKQKLVKQKLVDYIRKNIEVKVDNNK